MRLCVLLDLISLLLILVGLWAACLAVVFGYLLECLGLDCFVGFGYRFWLSMVFSGC